MRGRKPKDPGRRVNRVEAAHGWVEVADVPFTGYRPRLPKDTPPSTRDWWRALSTMPHCILWAPSDWQFSLDTVLIHQAVAAGQLRYAGELRQRERIMGTTVEARRDLRIRYVSETEDAAGNPPAPMTAQEALRWKAIVDAD